MAKEVVNRQVSIFIESGQAKRAYDELIKKEQRLNAEMAKTTDPKRMAQLKKELDKLQEPISRAAKKASGELNPSISELRKTVNRLNAEMNRMATNDPAFPKVAAQVAKARQELTQMEANAKKVGKEMAGIGKEAKKGGIFSGAFWGSFTGNIAATALSYLKQIGTEILQIVKEAPGVRRAFDRLNQPNLLAELRKATKGTVDDLELMKRAVSANNFQIPLENLGTYLQFAQRRARETGENVDYLVNSIVTGLGRKSPLILDNLGISAARLSEEFKRTGDFGAAAAKIINEEMAKMGPSIDDISDSMDQVKAAWSNVLLFIGETLSDLVVKGGTIVAWTMAEVASMFGDNRAKIGLMLKEHQQQLARIDEETRKNTMASTKKMQDAYVKSDADSRKKIVAQAKQQIKDIDRLLEKAYEDNNQMQVRQLNIARKMWEDSVKSMESGALLGSQNTIKALENHISVLRDQLKNLRIGSTEFLNTQKDLRKAEEELAKASGKSAEEAAKALADLRKQYEAFDEALRKSKLGAEYGEMMLAFYEINKEATDQQKQLAEFLKKGVIDVAEYERRMKDVQFVLEKKRDELNERFKKKPITIPVQVSMQELTNADAIAQAAIEGDKLWVNTRKRLIEIEAKEELDILQSTGRKRLDLQIAQLEKERNYELRNKELTESQRLLIHEKYRQKIDDLETDYWENQAQNYIEFANQIVSTFQAISSIFAQNENNELQRIDQSNEKKKRSYDRLLEQNLITREEYDRKVAQLDAQADKKRAEIERKQFERNKAAQIVQAGIQGAQNALKTVGMFGPPIPPNFLGIAAMALTVGETIAKVLAIRKATPPASYGGGGELEGPPHSDNNGMPVTNPKTGQVQAYLEGNEGIVNKRTMKDRRTYTVTGTPSQIASRLNSLHGGVHWASGATITPVWRNTPVKRINYQAVNQSYQARRMYADGGPFNGTSSSAGESVSAETMEVIMQLSEAVGGLTELLSLMRESGIKAYTVLTEHEAQQGRLDAIRAEATMR